jgi:hypothetical protein
MFILLTTGNSEINSKCVKEQLDMNKHVHDTMCITLSSYNTDNEPKMALVCGEGDILGMEPSYSGWSWSSLSVH